MIVDNMDSDAEICFNCMHKYSILCTLGDELIEDVCTCQMFRKDKIKKR